MNAETHELLIQRLVDGEMEASQRSHFLRELDRHPELWRRLALAFLEDQALRLAYHARSTDGKANTNGEAEFGKGPTPIADRAVAGGHPSASGESGPAATPWKTPGQVSPRNRAGWLAASAVVALCAFGTGRWSARDLPSAVGAAIPDVLPQSPQDARNQNAITPTGRAGSDYRLQIVDRHAGGDRVTEIPLVDSQPWPVRQTRIPEPVEQALMESGYELHQDTHYISGQLEDGRSLVVPVNRVNLKFRGQ